jgi:hypothetical protein
MSQPGIERLHGGRRTLKKRAIRTVYLIAIWNPKGRVPLLQNRYGTCNS